MTFSAPHRGWNLRSGYALPPSQPLCGKCLNPGRTPLIVRGNLFKRPEQLSCPDEAKIAAVSNNPDVAEEYCRSQQRFIVRKIVNDDNFIRCTLRGFKNSSNALVGKSEFIMHWNHYRHNRWAISVEGYYWKIRPNNPG